jgi:hypothetical protein
MQIQAYTCTYMPYMQIHAKFCTYVFGMYESLYVYVYFCRYIHIHTHKSIHIVCMCMYCMYVLSYFCAYLVHIVHMLCILYVFFAAKIARRDIHTRYIQYIQIHTHMHKHTYIIHTHMHSNTCKYIQFAIVISQFWVNAYVYVSYVSCMYLVCISVDIFQSICACIVCIVCMRMYAVCMVCIGRGKH